ncbi:hypothetical protein ACJZ2D_012128 [Fusarium nematophilum]
MELKLAKSYMDVVPRVASRVALACRFTMANTLGNMMTCLEGIASSSMIKFVVGPGEKVSFIHKDLVARQSRALDVLVNGPMVEAQEGCVRWKDVDEETFNRFFRFMYTGDYAGAKPTLRDGLRAEEEDGEEDEEEEEEEEEEEDEEEDEEEEEPPIPGERPTTGSEYTPWMYFSSGPDRRTHSAMSTTFAGLYPGEREPALPFE